MRILRIVIALTSFLFMMLSYAYPQKNMSLQHLFGYEGYSLDRNQVQFNQPKDLIFYADTLRNDWFSLECLFAKESPGIPNRYHKTFLSKDSNFLICTAIPSIYCRRNDSVYVDFELLPDMRIEINTYHLNHIKGDFIKNMGKRNISISNLPLTYKSSKYAHEAFNADTVITYPLRMWDRFENKYTHCLVILLQKRYRGIIPLYCLYTDEGAKKLRQYLKSLKRVFWYRNPKDYIEVKEPVRKDEYVLPIKVSDPNVVRIVGCL